MEQEQVLETPTIRELEILFVKLSIKYIEENPSNMVLYQCTCPELTRIVDDRRTLIELKEELKKLEENG